MTTPRTRILNADAEGAIPEAARQLRDGKLVAFPTETVYGLGANALDADAVTRLFAAKGRPSTNPLIVHIFAESQVAHVAATWPAVASQLAAKFWPGPLTLVVPKHPAIPDSVTGGGPTVAVRCPAHPVAQALLVAVGLPIAAPSANRSGELSPTTASHVARSLDGRIDLILDGGPCSGGIESTVVDVSGPTVRLLRPGLISVADLEALVGLVELGLPTTPKNGAMPSPGMLTKHYAPQTPLEVADGEGELEFLANLYETAGLKVARVKFLGDPQEVAAQLYAELHRLDDAKFDRIIVQLPPNTDDWRAVRDRLTRAAAE